MKLVYIALFILFLPLLFFLVARLVRAFFDFPMPAFLADLIDNPLRRRIQPPVEMPLRHGIREGMRVLEVGPGNGRYSVETARQIGCGGMLAVVDIEHAMLKKTMRRAKDEEVINLVPALASVHCLPFTNNALDATYMIAVIGEIPQLEKAMGEFWRVLSTGGMLAFSELLPDPDFMLPKTLIHLARGAGFHLKNRVAGWLTYTLLFQKDGKFSSA